LKIGCWYRPFSEYIPQRRWTASLGAVEETAVAHGPDFVLGLCLAVGTFGGILIGFYTGWLFPLTAAGLAVGLVVGAKLNPDDVGRQPH
jgi:hypothetical protein